jgi:Ca2+-binding EF-hand superfamily protein
MLRRTANECVTEWTCGHAAGFQLDQHAFTALFNAYDPDRSNSLGMAEFIAMTVFLRQSANIFAAFDSHRTGEIRLTYNQFIYATANCR